VLDDPGIDTIDVATPNHLHAEVALAALRAGKDVLLEKPMATTVADCDALLAAERETGRLVSVGHELRQSAQWGRIKALIDEDAIGDPLFLGIDLFRNFYRSGAAGWRYDRARVGSWMLEEAVHYFDLALWYLARHGDPVSIRAVGNQRAGREAGMYDNVSVLLRYASGAYVTINQSVAGFEHHRAGDRRGRGRDPHPLVGHDGSRPQRGLRPARAAEGVPVRARCARVRTAGHRQVGRGVRADRADPPHRRGVRRPPRAGHRGRSPQARADLPRCGTLVARKPGTRARLRLIIRHEEGGTPV
jgi:hypothetical protein